MHHSSKIWGAAVAALLTWKVLPAHGQGVTIGAVIPLSGPSATSGEDQRRGIELAVEEVNAAGGLLGGPLKL